MNFEQYLQQSGYRKITISQKIRHVEYYLNWLKENKLTTEQITYAHLMEFIGSLQQKNQGKAYINQYLNTLEHYYSLLNLPNPAQGVRLRNPRKAVKPMFTKEELDMIYEHYDLSNRTGRYLHTDKPMLSLIIYQALDPRDLYELEVKDVNLKEGKLYVNGRWNRKARKLTLEAHQVLTLHEYINLHRGKDESSKLFIAQVFEVIEEAARYLNRYVKRQAKHKLNLDIKNLQHLRQSRLALWVKQYGLRQAQYMAGFKSIDGIQRYQVQHLEDLQKSIDECHPLK